MVITNKVNYKTEGEENMNTILKENVLIENSAQHIIGDTGAVVLAEAEMSAIKLDESITILDNGDIFEDEDGDNWIKAGIDIVPLMHVEEEFSVSMSLAKDQLNAVYDLFDDAGMLKGEDN